MVAGGSGARFGKPKQYEHIAGVRMIDRSVAVARAASAGVVVVVPAADVERERSLIEAVVVAGGATRSESVRAGLAAVPAAATVVLVHDAARPCASPALYAAVVAAVAAGAAGAIPGVPVTDTIKVVDASEATTDSARSLFRAKDQLDAAAQIDAGKSQDFQLITVMSHSERAVRLTLTADDPATTNVFDLRQATIAPLPPELAGGDPANFPDVVTASAGNWYPTGLFDVRFEGLSRSNGPVQGNALAEGDEAAIVKVRVRNGSRGERTVNLTAVLYDDKGQTYGLVLTDDRLIPSNPTLGAAKSVTAEAGLTLATTVPKKTKIVRVKISEGKGHAFELKL